MMPYAGADLITDTYPVLDTSLSEMLVPMTRTDEFNQALEIQQSESCQ